MGLVGKFQKVLNFAASIAGYCDTKPTHDLQSYDESLPNVQDEWQPGALAAVGIYYSVTMTKQLKYFFDRCRRKKASKYKQSRSKYSGLDVEESHRARSRDNEYSTRPSASSQEGERGACRGSERHRMLRFGGSLPACR